MFLLTGLGNPGDEYSRHRHNVGFIIVDEVVDHYNFSAAKSKYQGEISDGIVGLNKVISLKPMTYMNESGVSLQKLMSFYKIPPEQVIVIHDDLDVPIGKIRVKQGGGHGGHNGLRSIDSHIGKNYHRIRIGISHPGDKNQVSDYVLHKFSNAEQEIITKITQIIVESLPLLLAGDRAKFLLEIDKFMKLKR